LRIAGAFNEGTRTGSFIFWRENGVREAHVPYDNGVRHGTVAGWYDGAPGREPARQFEAAWRHGARDGETRSWYPDGHRRSQTQYANGRIVATLGWTGAGQALSDAAARALALRDAQAADADYAKRDALITQHMARCTPGSPRPPSVPVAVQPRKEGRRWRTRWPRSARAVPGRWIRTRSTNSRRARRVRRSCSSARHRMAPSISTRCARHSRAGSSPTTVFAPSRSKPTGPTPSARTGT